MIHTALGVAAVASGAAVVLQRKGTARHRALGRIYIASMLGLNGTALVMYRLTGTFNFFHVAALFSLLVLFLGIAPTRARPFLGRYVEKHAYFMSGSYVGVLAATGAEIATRIPGFRFVPAAIGASVVICLVGSWIVIRRVPDVLTQLSRPGEHQAHNVAHK